MDYKSLFSSASILLGLLSACSWLYASQVKVSREKAIKIIKKKAKKKNEQPNFSGIAFDGWDFRETLKAQSQWNSIGAIFASISMGCQVVIQTFF